ncbi:hypothetical protein FRC01_004570 [Tulasnella sp. 417]|nr:hypothetical protein FRC01_004570 [Tulasnella sp. 417]
MQKLSEVKSVLSEVLEGNRRRGDDTNLDESQDPSERERSARDSEDSNDNLRVEEWEFYRLCEWIQNQVQENGLEQSETCRRIVDKIEARCAIANSKTAKAPTTSARQQEPPQGETIEGAHNPSPISLLPVEILQQIFRLVATPHTWVRAPLVLSHINSYFRNIVLDIPPLWAVVHSTLPLPIFQLYIARSRDEPLKVLIKTDFTDQNWFRFLNAGPTRVVHVAVVGSDEDLLSEWGIRLQSYEESSFECIRTLAIRMIGGTDYRVLCPTWYHFSNLRELWLERCWCRGWVAVDDPFPPTLRKLRLSNISDVSLENLLTALDGVSGLVGLVMEDVDLDADLRDDLHSGENTPNRVSLDLLEKLELSNVQVDDMQKILSLVSTPNLSSFSLTSSDPSAEITAFLEGFTNRQAQLSSLRILAPHLDWERLKIALHNLANLRHLRIRGSNLTEDNLAVLRGGTLFPRLTVVVS